MYFYIHLKSSLRVQIDRGTPASSHRMAASLYVLHTYGNAHTAHNASLPAYPSGRCRFLFCTCPFFCLSHAINPHVSETSACRQVGMKYILLYVPEDLTTFYSIAFFCFFAPISSFQKHTRGSIIYSLGDNRFTVFPPSPRKMFLGAVCSGEDRTNTYFEVGTYLPAIHYSSETPPPSSLHSTQRTLLEKFNERRRGEAKKVAVTNAETSSNENQKYLLFLSPHRQVSVGDVSRSNFNFR